LRRETIRLLPEAALLKTGDVDHADWNYRPVLGHVSRLRFKLVSALLPNERAGHLLEIGYGSGVLLPELARRCTRLSGLDIHPHTREVADALRRHNVEASLHTGSASAMPFADAEFDSIVAVSALEFIPDLDAACREMRRVLKPGGALVVVTPGHSALVDFGLRLMTRESAKKDYGGRRELLLPTLARHFDIEKRLSSPALGGPVLRLYTALRLRPRPNHEAN
jgi:ubiquinone/menaquinone biosynthesis C-methylase UbiE